MARIGVVIVSFNTRDKLRRCLAALEPHLEVVVVDNASIDGSPEMVREEFPGVKLVPSNVNLGFGRANNLGCSHLDTDLVLFLNSDAYAFPGAVDLLATVFDDPAVVAAGGGLRNIDGSRQESIAGRLTLGAVFLEQTLLERTGFFGHYWRTAEAEIAFDRTGNCVDVEQVMGACIMVRANKGQPLESFDPRYFLYCEDTDLCYRLRQHGRIVFLPTAEFTHELGSSSARDPALGIIRYNLGKELYFRIHHGPIAAGACWLLDRMGALLRLLAWCILLPVKPQARRQVATFSRVLLASGRDPAVWPSTPG